MIEFFVIFQIRLMQKVKTYFVDGAGRFGLLFAVGYVAEEKYGVGRAARRILAVGRAGVVSCVDVCLMRIGVGRYVLVLVGR